MVQEVQQKHEVVSDGVSTEEEEKKEGEEGRGGGRMLALNWISPLSSVQDSSPQDGVIHILCGSSIFC